MPEERVSTEIAIWVFAENLFQCVPTSDQLLLKAKGAKGYDLLRLFVLKRSI